MRLAEQHAFLTHPNRTILWLSFPVTLSVIAEPLTGMMDAAFVAQLGTSSLAALGIGAAVLSTMFWIFVFLGISTQTEVAYADGFGNQQYGHEITSLALILSLIFGGAMVLLAMFGAELFSAWLGAEGAVRSDAAAYIRLRGLGAPAVMITFVGFGALRGLQDMKTPLWVAGAVNILNIALDVLFIFGWTIIPPMGIEGAALASSISQWIGAAWVLKVVSRRLSLHFYFRQEDIKKLLRVGEDLFIRTGLLTLFILLTTRAANDISPEAGAAHQAIRTVWLFLGFLMEGYAVTVQSLVGYFLGANRVDVARRAAKLATLWGLGTGSILTVLMLCGTSFVERIFLPATILIPFQPQIMLDFYTHPTTLELFYPAWVIAAVVQPLAGLAFISDGIHWGTGDYTFLRNVMFAAVITGVIGLIFVEPTAASAFTIVWLATGATLLIRALLGVIRVFPGFGSSPLRV